MPTAANLNLYRGWNSCVGWHCDDEPLFGKCGDAKLIVSVSLGTFALFRWRRQSCPDAHGSSVSVMVNAVFGLFCFLLVSSWCFVHMGSTSFTGLPVVHKTWVIQVCLLLDTPCGRWRHYLCNLWGENFKIH